MEIEKRGMRFSLSAENFAEEWVGEGLSYKAKQNPDYRRKVDRIEIIPPSTEEIELHAEATRLWARLEELGALSFEPGGGAFVPDLEPRRVTHYAETHEEWLARCRALEAGE